MTKALIHRRRILRGMLQGTAVGVGLPLLDLFLNENGNALADGASLPVCFGTWHWGLGLCYGQWVPKDNGSGYGLPSQIDILSAVQDKINLYSGMQIMLDGSPTRCHYSGQQCIMTGKLSSAGFGRSIDDVVAEKIGTKSRFPALNVSCDGNPAINYSSRGGDNMNPAEISPLALYQRIFGSGYSDPNAADFVADPAVMLRKSALSVVAEDRRALMKWAGAADRERLDEFFTSLRTLERKLSLELEKPAPAPACSIPGAPQNENPTREVSDALHTHELFSELVCHALACGQTRVFNMTLGFNLIEAGDPATFHSHTHEDSVDPELGYQPRVYGFAVQYMSALKTIVSALDGIKEGDGTLLDRVLMLAYSDHGDSRIHTYTELPFFTAGRAGGRIKTGLHIAADKEPCNRLSLTCLRALGMPVESWGEGANKTDRVLSEVVA